MISIWKALTYFLWLCIKRSLPLLVWEWILNKSKTTVAQHLCISITTVQPHYSPCGPTHTHTVFFNWPLSLAEITGRFLTTSCILPRRSSSLLCNCVCVWEALSRWSSASWAELYMTTRWRNPILADVLGPRPPDLHPFPLQGPLRTKGFHKQGQIVLSRLRQGQALIFFFFSFWWGTVKMQRESAFFKGCNNKHVMQYIGQPVLRCQVSMCVEPLSVCAVTNSISEHKLLKMKRLTTGFLLPADVWQAQHCCNETLLVIEYKNLSFT